MWDCPLNKTSWTKNINSKSSSKLSHRVFESFVQSPPHPCRRLLSHNKRSDDECFSFHQNQKMKRENSPDRLTSVSSPPKPESRRLQTEAQQRHMLIIIRPCAFTSGATCCESKVYVQRQRGRTERGRSGSASRRRSDWTEYTAGRWRSEQPENRVLCYYVWLQHKVLRSFTQVKVTPQWGKWSFTI